MIGYSTVIFDLDGTLLDTIELIVESHRHALATVLAREEPEEVLRAGIGVPLLEQMRGFDEQRAQELFDAYRVFNRARHDEFVREYDGVLDVVAELRAAGVPIGIATSKMLDAVELAYAFVPRLRSLVDATVGFESTATHKPGPEPILHALELLGRPIEGACYVGDAPTDLAAAHAAGVDAIAVTWGAFSREPLAAARPHAIADTPAELLAILLPRR